jgi:F-type H+-transporting ATPase subunit alpha
VQPPILKELSKHLRAEYAEYTEIVSLSRLQSGLSDTAERIVNRAEALLSCLQQGQYSPVSVAEEILLLAGLQKGILDSMDDAQRKRFRSEIYRFACERNQALVDALEHSRQDLTPDQRAGLEELMDAYMEKAQ